ncbi:MAG: AAA family ATPase [Acidobacteria bacterium]|nr:AAA family ATPase [Acidobacteriota bacterium]
MSTNSSPDIERALLGAVLLDNSVISDLSSVEPSDFSLDSHRRLYEAVQGMVRRGVAADVATLRDFFARRAQLPEVGGAPYVNSLTEGAVPRSARQYLEILKQQSRLRRLERIGHRLQEEAGKGGSDPSELAMRVRSEIDALGSSGQPRLRVVSADELLNLEIPASEMILDPIIPAQGLTMIYSSRGMGKTYMGLGIAYAVATGGTFLRWSAPRPRKVLYVDGELPKRTLQERLAGIIAGLRRQPGIEADNLKLITPDLQEGPMPDLATAAGQYMVEQELGGAELLVLDNLSALVRSGKESEGEGWLPVQEWALRLRQRGVATQFMHHAGKSGTQRGTSRREDLLDVVIALRQPPNYSLEEGLRCQVHFEKVRRFCGDAARPFQVRMRLENDVALWEVDDEEEFLRASELFRQGATVRKVAEELGISKSKAARLRPKTQAAVCAT